MGEGGRLALFSVTIIHPFLRLMSVHVGGGGDGGVWVCGWMGRGHRSEGDVEVLRVE